MNKELQKLVEDMVRCVLSSPLGIPARELEKFMKRGAKLGCDIRKMLPER